MPGRVIMWNAASPSARGMHGARRPPLPGAAYMRDGGDRKGRRPGIRAAILPRIIVFPSHHRPL